MPSEKTKMHRRVRKKQWIHEDDDGSFREVATISDVHGRERIIGFGLDIYGFAIPANAFT